MVMLFSISRGSVWLACCRPEQEEKASSKTAAREKECILARNSITVLTKNQEKLIRSLSVRKNRKKTGLFVAEGMKLVTDFLNSGLVAENIFVVDSADAQEITGPVEWISEAEMKRITFLETPSPVLAVFEVPQAEELDWAGMVLVLDRLQDPGNVGTLLRTALWYGITNVVALTGTADCWSPKVVQSSMSALAQVKVHAMDEGEFLSAVKESGAQLVIADMAGTPARGFNWTQKTALVLGNEGQGVSPVLKEMRDATITLPGDASKMESLNVAVSGATLLYEYAVSQA